MHGNDEPTASSLGLFRGERNRARHGTLKLPSLAGAFSFSALTDTSTPPLASLRDSRYCAA